MVACVAAVPMPVDVRRYLLQWYGEAELDTVERALVTPPSHTFIRVNTMMASVQQAQLQLQEHIDKTYAAAGWPAAVVQRVPGTPDILCVPNTGPHAVSPAASDKAVMVDQACGQAVMRGADVFIPGILACDVMQCGDCVAVYVDLDKQCLFGQMGPFNCRRQFIGNGVAMISRIDRFSGTPSAATSRGIGVRMTEPIYRAPSLPTAPSPFFLQNYPSILVGHILNPQPRERVLDMCAAPGGKATHAAILMRNQGSVIACDKSSSKAERLHVMAKSMNITCVAAWCQDSTKITESDIPRNSCDRILLDPPCSGVGQRPLFKWESHLTLPNLLEYPSYQRLLFRKAMEKLKRDGGTLVYSTCTIHPAENEELVAWALRQYSDTLRLVPIAMPAWPARGISRGMVVPEKCIDTRRHQTDEATVDKVFLTRQEADCVLRFEPSSLDSTIGFFIAKFEST